MDPVDPYAVSPPMPGYWDDDLERRFQEAMASSASPFSGTDETQANAPEETPAGRASATLLPPAPPPATVEEQLAFKQAQYEREGMTPDEIAKAQAYNRPRYEQFERDRTKPPPGSPPEMIDAWLAKSPNMVAHIAQATGPVGTIGQIGQDEVPIGAVPSLHEPASLSPPPLSVDAVSGVDQRPPDDAFTSTSPMPTERPEEELSAVELGARWAALPVEEQIKRRREVEDAKQNFASAEMLAASKQAIERAEANARDLQTALKESQQKARELDADAQRVAGEKIDPLGNISIGRKIAGVLASFFGGFAANKTGRNMGLEVVDQMINDEIEVQKANIANKRAGITERRSALADEYGKHGDLFKAAETVRLAAYDSAIKTLETKVQQFDPRGTTALKAMDDINAFKQRRAEMLAKYQTDQQKRIEDALKLQREYATLQETQRHNIAGEKADATRAYADLLRAKTEGKKATAEVEVLPPEYYEMQGLPKPATNMSKKDYAAWLENKGKAQQQSNSALATTNAVPGVTIKTKDGTAVPFVAVGTPESVEKLRVREAKIREIVSLIDDARRTRSGWSSDVGNSSEKQQLDAIWGKAKITAKDAFELGQITAADEALIKGALGTDNPSKLRDPREGMKKARSLLIKGVRVDLDAHGFPKDQTYDIADLGESAPRVQSDNDRLLAQVLKNAPASAADDKAAQARARSDGTGYIVDSSRLAIEKWAMDARSDDPVVRDVALASLEKVAKSGNKGAKDLAAAKLQSLATPDLPVSESAGGPRGSVAHEAMPDRYGLPPEGTK